MGLSFKEQAALTALKSYMDHENFPQWAMSIQDNGGDVVKVLSVSCANIAVALDEALMEKNNDKET